MALQGPGGDWTMLLTMSVVLALSALALGANWRFPPSSSATCSAGMHVFSAFLGSAAQASPSLSLSSMRSRSLLSMESGVNVWSQMLKNGAGDEAVWADPELGEDIDIDAPSSRVSSSGAMISKVFDPDATRSPATSTGDPMAGVVPCLVRRGGDSLTGWQEDSGDGLAGKSEERGQETRGIRHCLGVLSRCLV